MSLLAGPRKKQYLPLDPRNKRWQNESDKIGKRLLEKCGWNQGKGLGRQEQGITDALSLKTTVDNHGVGFSAKDAEVWIQHSEDFSQILSALHQTHQQSPALAAPSDKVVVSHTARNPCKIRYKKFLKVGDVSTRTDSEMFHILGQHKSAHKAKPSLLEEPEAVCDSVRETFSAESSSADSGFWDEKAARSSRKKVRPKKAKQPAEQPAAESQQQITSAVNMHEYFANKIQMMKERKKEGDCDPGEEPPKMARKRKHAKADREDHQS